MLTPREIIAQAWAITTSEPTLRWWGFIGALFEILLDIKLIIYQIYFITTYLHGEAGGFFDIEIMLYHSMPPILFWALILGFLLLLAIEMFAPSFATGAIIGLSAKAHDKKPLKGGFIMALYNFFPIFAIHEVFIFSTPTILITAISLILRYGESLKIWMLSVAVIIWVLSNIIKFFSSFTESGVVVDKLGVFESGAKSVKLIFSYLPHVMFLLLLLSIITIRIIMNSLIITLIPGIIIGSSVLLTYIVKPSISYVIGGVLGFFVTMIAAYFFAYLHIFKQAVWTIMYIEITKEKELDTIR